jgi:hypothetical protein
LMHQKQLHTTERGFKPGQYDSFRLPAIKGPVNDTAPPSSAGLCRLRVGVIGVCAGSGWKSKAPKGILRRCRFIVQNAEW